MDKNHWVWEQVKWCSLTVDHFSTTLDGKLLWIESDKKGYIYEEEKVVLTLDSVKRRIYGKDQNHYMDLDQEKFAGLLYPERKELKNIWDGVLNYYNEVIAITPQQREEFLRVIVVNWIPYFIKK
jgi:hypothetical protein